jgi:hypothetical protein
MVITALDKFTFTRNAEGLAINSGGLQFPMSWWREWPH